MVKPINILDSDYIQWIKELGSRYRRSQIKAAIKVNTILEHRTDPDFDRFIETTRQNIETERLQNEEIKKAQGDIQAVMVRKKQKNLKR